MLQLFTYMAWLSTVLFAMKIILVMIGAHHGTDGSGGDIGHDFHAGHSDHSAIIKAAHVGHTVGHHHSDFAFKLWSFQSVLAFCMGMGWTGQAALVEWNYSLSTSIIVSAAFGFLMALLSALLMAFMSKLNAEPDEYNLSTCVGKSAKVYLPIPSRGNGTGQIEVELGGGLKIVSAVSERDAIKQFSDVKITSAQENMVVVSPINQ